MQKLWRGFLIIVPLCILVSAAKCETESGVALPRDWIERPAITSQAELHCANRRSAWQVSVRDGEIVALPAPESLEQGRLAFPDGELIGINRGEWGGVLLWRATDGSETQLLSDNTRYLFTWNGRVFAAGGLAHMSLDEGFIAQLERVETGWRVARRTDLPGSVEAIDYSDASELIVASTNGVYTFDGRGEVKKIFASENWWSQYPNSLVRLTNGDVLVGMRYSISRLRSTGGGYVETLLVPELQRTCATGRHPLR